VPWLGTDDDDDDDDDDGAVLALLDSGDDSVDDPVTSGSDPTSWDPIDVDKEH
jgi:hypothetical protein